MREYYTERTLRCGVATVVSACLQISQVDRCCPGMPTPVAAPFLLFAEYLVYEHVVFLVRPVVANADLRHQTVCNTDWIHSCQSCIQSKQTATRSNVVNRACLIRTQASPLALPPLPLPCWRLLCLLRSCTPIPKPCPRPSETPPPSCIRTTRSAPQASIAAAERTTTNSTA